jgi:hypothetical protein
VSTKADTDHLGSVIFILTVEIVDCALADRVVFVHWNVVVGMQTAAISDELPSNERLVIRKRTNPDSVKQKRK